MLTGRKIWALDEPTVALDTKNVDRFAGAITAHLKAGGIAVIATHIDLGFEAEKLDLSPFQVRATETLQDFDEAFL